MVSNLQLGRGGVFVDFLSLGKKDCCNKKTPAKPTKRVRTGTVFTAEHYSGATIHQEIFNVFGPKNLHRAMSKKVICEFIV